MENQPLQPTLQRRFPATPSSASMLDGTTVLTPGDHLSGFYGSDLGLATLSVRFILDGLQEGSMVYVVASARSIKRIMGYLKEKRPSLQRDVSTGRLLFCEYRKGPRAQIKDFETQLNKAAAEGAQTFRVFGDTWEMRKKVSSEAFAEYEALYDQHIARRFPVVTLCAYDVRKFSGVDVRNALKAHRFSFRYLLESALA
jgi:hypothetical protein